MIPGGARAFFLACAAAAASGCFDPDQLLQGYDGPGAGDGPVTVSGDAGPPGDGPSSVPPDFAGVDFTMLPLKPILESSGTMIKLKAVSGNGPNRVVAAGDSGIVVAKQNGGGWQTVNATVTTSLYSVAVKPDGTTFVGGDNTLVESTNLVGWGSVPNQPAATFFAAWLVAPDGVLFGSEGLISRYGSNSQWLPEWQVAGQNVVGLWADPATGVGYAALDGDGFGLLVRDGTRTWTPLLPSTGNMTGVAAVDLDHAILVGASGVILHLVQGSWKNEGPGGGDLNGAWAGPPSDFWAVGDGGLVLRSPGDGTWAAMPTGTPENLEAVWGSSSNDVYVVGGGGTIVHYLPN